MLKRPSSDFWKVGILRADIETVQPQSLRAARESISWLPDPGPWRYLADPFGLVRGDTLHVFVEAFDYRDKHGVIERHELCARTLGWRGKRRVLEGPFHLSYPYVFEHGGEAYMVPESHQAGEIALYRGDAGLNHWTRVGALLELPGAEASLIQHGGRWWMFFTVVGPKGRDQRELHLAYAPTLTGPWQLHASNPLLDTLAGARPGGTPFLNQHGRVVLPVQDCRRGYGAALRLLEFEILEPRQLVARHLAPILKGEMISTSHVEGLHTLSACAGFTLLDAKRIDHGRQRQWLDLRRRLRRLLGRAASRQPGAIGRAGV